MLQFTYSMSILYSFVYYSFICNDNTYCECEYFSCTMAIDYSGWGEVYVAALRPSEK